MIRIVNIKSKEKYTLYIGRENKYYNLEKSIFSNPYVIGKDGNREEVIEKFRIFAENNKEILDNLHLIDNQILGCYCYPEKCHGEILIELRKKQVMENNQKKYRVGIVGSRDYNNKEEIYKYLDSKIDKIQYLVSGGCPTGGDFLGQCFAKDRGLSILVHYPNWTRDGKGAGFRRNAKIVNDSDIIVAFWSGKEINGKWVGSKGTEHTINLAKKQGKKVIIHKVEPDEIEVPEEE